MISMVVNIVLCLILIAPLKHIGLALSTSIASIVNAALLYIVLRRENVYKPRQGWIGFALRVGLAALLMGLFLWWFMGPDEQWLTMSVWLRAARLIFLVSVAGAIYFVSLLLLGLKPMSMLKSSKV